MPTIVQTFQGRVTGLWGTATMRGTDGRMRLLKIGDLVQRGDVILTSQDGIVQLSPDETAAAQDAAAAASATAATAAPGTVASADIDRVISGLDDPNSADATAAGVAGGDGAGDLSPGLRVDRVSEGTTPAGLAQPGADADPRADARGVASVQTEEEAPRNAANTAPVGNTDSAATQEDTALAGNVLANDSDADGNALVVTQYTIGGVTFAAGSATTLAGIGTLVLNADGSYGFTPAANYAGPVPSITYTLSDGTATTTSTLTIDVAPVNDAPVALADIASTPINVPITVAVLANDTDPDSDPITVTSAVLANPAQGTVTVNPNGTVTYAPATNVTGAVTITYTVADGQGGTGTASVTVNVGSNTPPVGADNSRSTAEDTAYTVQTADFGFADADAAQTLANVRIDTLPAAGSLLLAGSPVSAGAIVSAADIVAGRLVFVPAAEGNGSPYASFTFSVQDSAGAFDTMPNALTLTVTPVNDAPVARADAGNALEDNPATGNVLVNDNDVDGTPLQVSQFTVGGTTYAAGSTAALAGVGTLLIRADGSYTFTPAANYNGPVPTATYTATDGTLTSTATLNLAITPVNDAPLAADDLASTPINTPLVITVLANDGDPENDPLTVTTAVLGDPAQGTVTINPNGTLAFTPANNTTGTVVITYTVSDGRGGVDTANVTVNVGNNTPPAGADSARTIAEDTSYTVQTGDFGFADADAGQTLANIRIDSLPAAGTLLLNGTAVLAGAVISAADVAAGRLVFVPVADANGSPYASFTFSVQDSAGAFDTAPNTLTLNVTPGNDVPVAVADTVAAIEDQTFLGTVAGNDTLSPDGGNVFALVTGSGPVNGATVFNADGSFTYTPNANYNGADAFTYSLTDIDGSVSTATVAINVASVNDVPVAVADTVAVVEDTPLVGTVAGNDTLSGDGGNTFALVGGSGPANGGLVFNADGSFTYTPNANYNGADAFTYSLTDANGDISTATVTLNVASVNDVPVAVIDTVAAIEDTPLVGTVATNDALSGDGGNVFGLVAGSGPANGGIVFNANGTFTYTPSANYTGADSFTYSLTDANGDVSTANVTINVAAVNDVPVAVADTVAAVEDTPLVGTVATNDTLSGDGGNVFALVAGSGPANGGIVFNANGTFTYTPSANYNGADAFSYSLTDANGDTSTATVTINVAAANDAPVAVADAANASEAGGVANGTAGVDPSGNVLTNDTDVDVGDAKTVSAVSGTGAGTVGGSTTGAYGSLVLGANGSYTYSVDNTSAAVQALRTAGNTLTDTFTYTLRDAAGASSSATLSVTISGSNDAPVAVVDTAAVTENATLTRTASTGVLANDTDVDSGDAKTVSAVAFGGTPGAVGSPLVGTYGTLTLGTDGSYAYIANRPAADALGAGQTATETFSYTVTDAAGASSAAALQLTITGTNDAPTLSLDANQSHNTVVVQAISGLFNTGQSNGGAALAQGTLDAHYTLVSAPAGSTLTPTTTGLPGSWVANDADSTWIGSTGNQPTGVYQYQTSFTLQPGADPASVNISFDLSSDNNLRDILVNGVSTGFSSNLQYAQFTSVALQGVNAAFGPGLNTITFVVDNRDPGSPGASGPTGLRIDNISGNVAVIVPDAVNAVGDYATIYVEGTPVSIADTDADVQDFDSPTLQSAVVTLTNAQAGDVLLPGALPPGIAASVNAAGTVVTLTGAASQASYEAAIRAVQFDNTSDTPPSAIDRIVTVVVSDGALVSNTATTTIHVVSVADAPRLDLDANNSTAAGTAYAGTYTENGAGIAIVDTDISILDSDSTLLRSATIRIVNAQPGDVLGSGALPAGISAAVYDPFSGVLTLSGSATIADYQAALRGITFRNTSDQPVAVTRDIAISVSDGLANSNVATSRITVVSVNDAPVAIADTAAVTEDVAFSRTAATGVLANDTDLDTVDTKTVSAVTFGATTGTVGSALAGTYGTLTLNADGSYTYLADRPAAQALAQGQIATEQFTYTVRDAAGATATTTLTLTITGTNDAPVANNDTGTVLAGSTLAQTATNGLILSAGAAAGRDTDADAGTTLTVVQAAVGTATPASAVAAAGTTFAGLYGDLLLRGDGSYSYVANRADAVATGTSASDIFTYRVSDGQGGTSTAALTIAVGGQADTLSAPAPTTTALTGTLGLSGEYYGYNDFNPSGANANRRHSDDGTVGNLDSVADFNALVNLRNAAKGGSGAILGSSTAALVDTADATFLARTIDYGGAPTVTNSLGSNINRAAGASTAGLTDANSALFKFLNRTGTGGSDAGSLAIRAGTADNDAAGAGPTAGLGTTSDAGIRLTGQVYLEAGVYDIRVTADDGYRLKLQNNTVAMFDGIQSPTTRVYSGVGVEGGLTPLELTYWEQGGNAVLKIEYKLAGTADSTYAVLGANAQPLFSDLNAPTLADNQHIVAGATPGNWLVQTGSVLDGGVGNDTLSGNTGSDLLRGGVGNDVLTGGAGADVLIGGKGNDTMNGGTGYDVFRWSLGDGGSADTPALDTINGFDNTNFAGDRLDLRDLLVGEHHLFNTVTGGGATAGTNALTINGNAGNLGDYLHFSSSAGNTVLEISSTGGFAGGFNSAAVDQVITITGTNLTAGFASDNAVITDLLQRGKLVTDGH